MSGIHVKTYRVFERMKLYEYVCTLNLEDRIFIHDIFKNTSTFINDLSRNYVSG